MTADQRAAEAYRKHTGKEFNDRVEPWEPASLLEAFELSHAATYGNSWSRTDLDMRTKCFITMTITLSLGQEEQFKTHVKNARHCGVTDDELVGMLIHFAAYFGAPRTAMARRVVREVWKEDQNAKK